MKVLKKEEIQRSLGLLNCLTIFMAVDFYQLDGVLKGVAYTLMGLLFIGNLVTMWKQEPISLINK